MEISVLYLSSTETDATSSWSSRPRVRHDTTTTASSQTSANDGES